MSFPSTLHGTELISGIIGSCRTNYPQIASKVPDQAKPESRVKRIPRFVNEADEKQEVHLMPFASALLSNLAERTLVLVMDGSEVGRGCLALMLSVLYRSRALPIAWLVISAKKGHFSQERYIKLLSAVQNLIPSAQMGSFGRWRVRWHRITGQTD
ncbi:MAG: hypothetical protein JXB85_04760 [Anaerolineales bacterium]|nr:hypothetical protein [Anaerolineales bacterium]